MKMKFTFFVLLGILLGSSFQSSAQADGDYRAAASGNWGSSATWEVYASGAWGPASAAPSSTDGVITIGNGYTVTVAAAVTADQVVVEAGSTLTVSAALTIADGAGSDLSIASNCILNIGAAVTVSGNLDNAGTINWSAGNISLASGSINNSGNWNMTGNNTILNASGTNAVANLAGGTITKNTGATNSDLQVPFNNAGTINVNSGTFLGSATTSVWTNSGTINLANSSKFSNVFNGTLTLNSGTSITGTGTVRLEITTINIPLTIPAGITLEVNKDLAVATGSLVVNGTLNLVANAIRIPTTVSSTGTFNITTTTSKILNASFTLNGTTNWTGGTVVMNATTLTNNGTFNVNTGAAASLQRFTSTTNSFINNGTFSKLDAGTTLTITSIPVTNGSTGTIKGVGTIAVTGAASSLTNSGTIAPGNSPGALTLDVASIAWNAGSTLQMEVVSNAGAGTGNDILNLTAATTDLSNITLNIVDDPNAPVNNYSLLSTTGTLTGNFAAVNANVFYNAPVVTSNSVTIQKTAILPLTWGDWFLKAGDGKILLTWNTLQESNTARFDIEHSADGIKYDVIGTVPAKGNSSTISTYNFTDGNPVARGRNFYRIHQVDLDGQATYSEIRSMSLVNAAGAYFSVYPNPVQDVLTVNVPGEAIDLVISDISGRKIRAQRMQPGSHTISFSDLPRGIYQVAAFQQNKVVASQLITKN